MAQPLWTLCVISSENLGLSRHGSLGSTCVMLEKELLPEPQRGACVPVFIYTAMWGGGLLLPLEKPSQQLQRELPRARASSQNMTSQTLWLDAPSKFDESIQATGALEGELPQREGSL